MKKTHRFYWTCGYCGDNLDLGEPCHCREEATGATEKGSANEQVYRNERMTANAPVMLCS